MELSEDSTGSTEINYFERENSLSHEYGAGSFSYSAKKGQEVMVYVSQAPQKIWSGRK